MTSRLRGLFEHEWRAIGSAIGTIGRRVVREELAEDMKRLIKRKYGILGGSLHSYDWDEWQKLCQLDKSGDENSN